MLETNALAYHITLYLTTIMKRFYWKCVKYGSLRLKKCNFDILHFHLTFLLIIFIVIAITKTERHHDNTYNDFTYNHDTFVDESPSFCFIKNSFSAAFSQYCYTSCCCFSQLATKSVISTLRQYL
jgi:hypothetical protein